MERSPGEIVAERYRLVRLLGQGGMGAVWSAEHTVTRKRVALKFLHASRADKTDRRRRFLREARAASAVRHPNVIAIHDVLDLPDGEPVMVMDLLEGESFATLLERQPRLPLPVAATLLVPVLEAVGAAHALGIVHRDLKPENVFLERLATGATRVVVLDFGIAKLTAAEGQAASTGDPTQTGAVLGTPFYMAPEQAFGEKDVDARVDVWALGLIAFQCLTGELPTRAESFGQVLKIVLTGEIPSVGDRAPDLPTDVVAVVDAMLQRERSARAADVLALRDVLRPHASGALDVLAEHGPAVRATDEHDAIAHGPTLADPGARTESADGASQPAPTPAARSPAEASQTGIGTRRVRRSLIIAGVLAAGAVGSLFVLGGMRGNDSAPPVASAASAAPTQILAAPDSVLACPLLDATGVEPPTGWLGAAASALACRRIQWDLGGDASRVVPPAALMDFPAAPGADFPKDPYGADDARTKAIAASRERADAHLDGRVEATASGFRVHLGIVARSGAVVGAGDAEARELVDAVDAAVGALEQARTFPVASRTTPAMERATLVTEPRIGWASERIFTDADRKALCTLDLGPFTRRSLRDLVRAGCAAIGEGPPPALAPLDRSSAADLAASVMTYLQAQWTIPDRAAIRAELQRGLETSRDADERGTIGCALASLDNGLAAVETSFAERATLGLENPWTGTWTCDLLASSIWQSHDARENEVASRFFIAWAPFATSALVRVGRTEASAEDGLRWARRDALLRPTDGEATLELARRLVRFDRVEEVRRLAAQRATGEGDARVAASYLRVAADAAEGLPARGMETAMDVIASRDVLEGSFTDLYGLVLVGQIATILGKDRSFADAWASRLAEARGPFRFVPPNYNPAGFLQVCVRASLARVGPCVERIAQGYPANLLDDVDKAFFLAARRVAADDLKGAAVAWRSIAHNDFNLRYIPVELIEKSGDDVLAERIDRAIIEGQLFRKVVRGHGMEDVREARRAAKRGDRSRARAIAKELVEVWSTLDTEVPWLAELKKLSEP